MTDTEWLEACNRRLAEKAERWGEAWARCLCEPTEENQRRELKAKVALDAATRELGRVRDAIKAKDKAAAKEAA